MAADFLQEFMTSGLLETVETDEMFQALDKAVASLAERFDRSPPLAITATLVALDGDASPNEPSFDTAEQDIIVHWKTFRGKYKDRPRSILRAVLLAALRKAAATSDTIAYSAWATAASVLPHTSLGREESSVRGALTELARRAEEIGVARFGGAATVSHPGTIPAPPTLDEHALGTIDVPQLTVRVAAAVGPQTNIPGATLTDQNPRWPNDPTNWAYEFAPRMARVLAGAVQEGTAETASALSAHVQVITETFADSLRHARGVELQVRLLGWAHALYSPSLESSYRTLDPVIAAVAMAHDAASELGAPTPASVAFSVSEAVRVVCGGDTRPLRSLLRVVADQEATLRKVVQPGSVPEGRVPLATAVSATVHGVNVAEALIARSRLGIDPDLSLSLPAFAMWCFRDLQAATVARGE